MFVGCDRWNSLRCYQKHGKKQYLIVFVIARMRTKVIQGIDNKLSLCVCARERERESMERDINTACKNKMEDCIDSVSRGEELKQPLGTNGCCICICRIYDS